MAKVNILLVLIVLAVLGLLYVGCAESQVSFDGIDLVKYWSGNMVDEITNVKIVVSNGTTVFDGPMPETHTITVNGVWKGQTATIVWSDPEGCHRETVGPFVGCGDTFSYTNVVNHTPKSKLL